MTTAGFQSAATEGDANERPNAPRTCLLVLGMHRSGTSALTRMLSLAGAELPLRLMPAGLGNETGHWEPQFLVDFHDRMLQDIGSSWHDWRQADFSMLAPEKRAALKAEMQKILLEDYPAGDIFVVKDPRLCRFAAFFMEAVEDLGCKVALIQTFRNPLDVVKSLNTRKGVWPADYTATDAALLWLRHVIDSEMDCLGRQRAVVSYDALMANPEQTLAVIERDTGLRFPKRWSEIEPEVRTFLSPTQRHHAYTKADLDANPDTRAWVGETYAALQQLEKGENVDGALASLKDVAQRFNEASTIFSRLTVDLRKYTEKELSARDGAIAGLHTQIETASSTTSQLQTDLSEGRAAYSSLQEALSKAENQSLELLQRLREVEIERSGAVDELHALQRQIATSFTDTRQKSAKAPALLRTPALMKQALRAIPQALGLAPPDTFPHDLPDPASTPRSLLADGDEPLKPRYAPLISIVVTSAQGAVQMKRRLSSVYVQDYKNIEVILLDDHDNAECGRVMHAYAERYPAITRLLQSDVPQNLKDRQWQHGLAAARGDLVWIAQPDDWTEVDFLSKMVPAFRDEGVLLAYCNAIIMNDDGSRAISSTADHLSRLDPQLWRASFKTTAHTLVRSGWGLENVVVGTSSALFRRPAGPYDVPSAMRWQDMAHCADWLFLLNVARGGRVHFNAEVSNFHTPAPASRASAVAADEAYFRERETVAKFCVQMYRPGSDYAEKAAAQLADVFDASNLGASFDQLFSIDRIRTQIIDRQPAILMASQAFTEGESRVLPIVLANLLRREGHAVTFLAADRVSEHDEIRQLLNSDIAVVDGLSDLNQIVRDFGIDIVHSHEAQVDRAVMEALPAKSPCRTTVTIHDSYAGLAPAERNRTMSDVVRRAGVVVYESSTTLASFSGDVLEPGNRTVHIAPALESAPFDPVDRDRLNLPRGAFVFCLAGPATAGMGWSTAIEAASLARKRSGLDIRLLLLGSGPEQEMPRPELAQDFALVLGFKRNPRAYFAASDMGLFPLQPPAEACPLGVIDCLAAGKPVLASAHGELPRMLSAGSELAGRVFDLVNGSVQVETLAAHMATLASDKEAYAQLKGAVEAAYKKFDPRLMVKSYISVYENLIRPARIGADEAHAAALIP